MAEAETNRLDITVSVDDPQVASLIAALETLTATLAKPPAKDGAPDAATGSVSMEAAIAASATTICACIDSLASSIHAGLAGLRSSGGPLALRGGGVTTSGTSGGVERVIVAAANYLCRCIAYATNLIIAALRKMPAGGGSLGPTSRTSNSSFGVTDIFGRRVGGWAKTGARVWEGMSTATAGTAVGRVMLSIGKGMGSLFKLMGTGVAALLANPAGAVVAVALILLAATVYVVVKAFGWLVKKLVQLSGVVRDLVQRSMKFSAELMGARIVSIMGDLSRESETARVAGPQLATLSVALDRFLSAMNNVSNQLWKMSGGVLTSVTNAVTSVLNAIASGLVVLDQVIYAIELIWSAIKNWALTSAPGTKGGGEASGWWKTIALSILSPNLAVLAGMADLLPLWLQAMDQNNLEWAHGERNKNTIDARLNEIQRILARQTNDNTLEGINQIFLQDANRLSGGAVGASGQFGTVDASGQFRSLVR